MRLFYIPFVFFPLLVAGVLFALATQTSLGNMATALLSPETLFALGMSLGVSVLAMGLSLIIGLPTAYVLAHARFPGKFILDIFLDLPLVMTPLVAGMGLLFLFGPGLLGDAAMSVGLNILFSPSGAVLAQTFIATPIVIRNCKTAVEGLDYHFEWAGQTMGLTPFQICIHVIFPMLSHDILSAAILAWSRAMGEFGATLMVAGATRFKTETLPVAVYLNITSGETGIAVACAWLLILMGFFLLLLLKGVEKMSSRKNNLYIQEG